MTAMLSFDGVRLDRGGRTLFEDLNFELGSGQGIHVTGPNGAGKSSLIRLAAGLLTARSGRIERHTAVAMADDQIALDRELALDRALAFWGGDWKRGLKAMRINYLAKVPVRLLSSGQRKRASLARVIGSGAALWLLDEPLNALDRDGANLISSAIADHRATGGAVLAASHLPLSGDWSEIGLTP